MAATGLRETMKPKLLPSFERLNELFEANAEAGVLTRRLCLRKHLPVGSSAGAIDSKGYVRVSVDGEFYPVHRILWKLFYGRDPTDQIDHINGEKTDNRICNLREVSNSQNQRNVGVRKNNRLGILGVHRMGRGYRAYITVDGKKTFSRTVLTIEQAIEQRELLEFLLHDGYSAAASRRSWAPGAL